MCCISWGLSTMAGGNMNYSQPCLISSKCSSYFFLMVVFLVSESFPLTHARSIPSQQTQFPWVVPSRFWQIPPPSPPPKSSNSSGIKKINKRTPKATQNMLLYKGWGVDRTESHQILGLIYCWQIKGVRANSLYRERYFFFFTNLWNWMNYH